MTEKMKATTLDGKQMLNNGDEMDDKQRTSGMTRTGTLMMATLCVAMLTLVCGLTLLIPGTAQAKVANSSVNSCSTSGCHPTGLSLQVPPAIQVAVENVTQAGASTIYSGAIAANAGDQLEIDWKFTGLEYNAGATSPVIWLPSGWTPTAGTVNSPPITLGTNNWSTAWDASTGEPWWAPAKGTDDTNTPDGWMIDYTTSVAGWGNQSGVARNDGTAGDLDTWSGEMGSDARITIPGGTPTGTYYIWVFGSGKGQQPGKTKALKASVGQMLTINVTGAANTAPTLTVNQPDGVGDSVTEGSSFNINYDLADAEQAVTVAFYYDTNNTGLDGTTAANCAAAPEGSGVNCAWDTTGVAPGDYFIYGITDDGIAAQVSAYSSGTVTVNAANTAPTLTVNQPDGVGDSVTEGSTFNIHYDLTDAEQTVTVAFYYDTNNSGLDGVAAANCAAAPEGTGVNCAWDTTGVTPGDYFIYGITDDGIAAQVSAYSSGTVTVDAPGGPDSLGVTSNTAIASSAVEGNTDVLLQRLQVDCTDGGGDDGVCEITGITVDDLGSVTGTEIDFLRIYIDTDTTFSGSEPSVADATFAGVAKAIDLTSIAAGTRQVTAGTPKYIWVAYDLAVGSAPATVQTSVTAVDVNTGSGDTGATGTWNSNNFAISAAGGPDSLSVNNTAVASFATEEDTDVQMQRLQVDCTAGGGDDGICEITGITVDDLGSVIGTEIDNLTIYIDTDTTFAGTEPNVADAAFAGISKSIDLTSITLATRQVSGTPKYIWVTYDLAAGSAPATVQTSVTAVDVNTGSGDTGAAGTWNSNSFAISAIGSGLGCADCHDHPPLDGTRDGSTGAVVGDHQTPAHLAATCNYCHVVPATAGHRNGDIEMKDGTIGDAASGDNGSYSRGATFAQSNSPTTGTCSNIDCHNNAVTPQWGVGIIDHVARSYATGGASPCMNCHDDSANGANWTVVTTHLNDCTICHTTIPALQGGLAAGVCTVCHTDTWNTLHATTPPDHSALVTTSGTNCTGCHEDSLVGATVTTHLENCSNCHNGDGSLVTTYNTNLQTFAGGGNCETCHGSTWGAIHITAPDHSSLVQVAATDCASCHNNTLTSADPDTHLADCSNCHSAVDGSLVTTLGTDTQTFAAGGDCTTCHGSNNWDTVHTIAPDHSALVTTTGTDNCASCHEDQLVGATATTHLENCSNCHSTTTGLLTATLGTDTQTFAVGGDCENCHSDTWTNMHFANHNGTTTHNSLVTVTGTTAGWTNCGSCHSDPPPLTDGADAKVHDACASCHATNGSRVSTAVGKDFTTGGDCETCHGTVADSTAFASTHTTHTASHTVAVGSDQSAGQSCDNCHDVTNWGLIEGTEHNVATNGAGSCATCHNSPTPAVISVISTGGSVTCLDCHADKTTAHGSIDHMDTGGGTGYVLVGGTQEYYGTTCASCHDPGGAANATVDVTHSGDCALCHTTVPALQPGVPAGGGNCADCHTPSVHTLWGRYQDTCAGDYGPESCHATFQGPGSSLHDAHTVDWDTAAADETDRVNATAGVAVFPYGTAPDYWQVGWPLTPTCGTCHTSYANPTAGVGCNTCHKFKTNKKEFVHPYHSSDLAIDCQYCHYND